VDSAHDLFSVDPLEIDARNAKIGVTELALDDVEWDTFASHLDCVRMTQLVRREPATYAGLAGDPPEVVASRAIRPGSPGGLGTDRAQKRPDRQRATEFKPANS
jgi:hypothetical protein